jgi:hypothetical protein
VCAVGQKQCLYFYYILQIIPLEEVLSLSNQSVQEVSDPGIGGDCCLSKQTDSISD